MFCDVASEYLSKNLTALQYLRLFQYIYNLQKFYLYLCRKGKNEFGRIELLSPWQQHFFSQKKNPV